MKIDPKRCMARSEPLRASILNIRVIVNVFGEAPRCQEPATHETVMGRRCARHAEDLREAMRNPHTLANALMGRARTEAEIAQLVVELKEDA